MTAIAKERQLVQACWRQILHAEYFLSGAGNGKPAEIHRTQLHKEPVVIQVRDQLVLWYDTEFDFIKPIRIRWRLPEGTVRRLVRAFGEK